MCRCFCWSNSGLCHYAISGWAGMKRHTVHSNQQANQSGPQVCYCHSEIGQSQEGFSCWSLFSIHETSNRNNNNKKNPLLICVHYLTARLEVLWFLLILCHSFKLSSLNKASCHYREYKPFHQHSRLRHNKLPVKSPVITGGQIRNWWRIHCSCLSFLECS